MKSTGNGVGTFEYFGGNSFSPFSVEEEMSIVVFGSIIGLPLLNLLAILLL